MENELIFKEESYKIIGCCFEVYNNLGKGYTENVYKDALEYEFLKNEIFYEREKVYKIQYKDIILPHHYFADFVLLNSIILEAKVAESLNNSHIKQTLNYLAVSKLKLGLLVNFGEESLKYKRILL